MTARPARTRTLALLLAAAAPLALSPAVATGPAPFRMGIAQDAKDPTRMTVNLVQAGIGMPNRDYCLSPSFAPQKAAYEAHVARLLTLSGVTKAEAKADAARIVALETNIASAHWTNVENRQAEQRYNPVAAAELPAKFPGVDWSTDRTITGIAGEQTVNVNQPSALAGIAQLVETAPIEDWKAWARYHVLRSSASVLPKALRDETFAFYGKTLSGTPAREERWKQAVNLTTGALGEAFGEDHVARHFPPEARAQMDVLVQTIIAAMDVRLQNLSWMDAKTKQAARYKLSRFKPKSRSEWFMTPMTVNAYANPSWNEIVFPAAILQPPVRSTGRQTWRQPGRRGAGNRPTHSSDARASPATLFFVPCPPSRPGRKSCNRATRLPGPHPHQQPLGPALRPLPAKVRPTRAPAPRNHPLARPGGIIHHHHPARRNAREQAFGAPPHKRVQRPVRPVYQQQVDSFGQRSELVPQPGPIPRRRPQRRVADICLQPVRLQPGAGRGHEIRMAVQARQPPAAVQRQRPCRHQRRCPAAQFQHLCRARGLDPVDNPVQEEGVRLPAAQVR